MEDFTYERLKEFVRELEENMVPTEPAVVPSNIALEKTLRNNIQNAEEEIMKLKESIFSIQKRIRGWKDQLSLMNN